MSLSSLTLAAQSVDLIFIFKEMRINSSWNALQLSLVCYHLYEAGPRTWQRGPTRWVGVGTTQDNNMSIQNFNKQQTNQSIRWLNICMDSMATWVYIMLPTGRASSCFCVNVSYLQWKRYYLVLTSCDIF